MYLNIDPSLCILLWDEITIIRHSFNNIIFINVLFHPFVRSEKIYFVYTEYTSLCSSYKCYNTFLDTHFLLARKIMFIKIKIVSDML